MKLLEINGLIGRLQTKHGIKVVVRELRNGDIRIFFLDGAGRKFNITPFADNIINIQII